MLLTDYLKPGQDQFELKVWALLLELIYDFSDNLKFFNEWNLLLFLVEKHARDMPVFNQKHILSDTSLQSFFGHLPEEWYELAEFSHLGKLLLEIFPDLV